MVGTPVATLTGSLTVALVETPIVAPLTVKEIQVILDEIHSKRMKFSEAFQEATLIDKLPLAWKDFKSYLMHKQKEMSIEDLIVRL